ncbi:ubiquitin-associated (UBA)/TS-N domain-containing protein-related [Raphanus sativus]|nr:ubiquitin-associated (UBA)/TS-N domain-containing protein-related [Raphanus sativus]
MADPLKEMCDKLGVCTEEALFYLEVAIGSSVADAVKYLSAYNWSILHAAASFCNHHYDQPEKKSKPMMPSSHEGSDLVQDVLSNVPQFRSDHTSTSVRIGSPPSSSKSGSGIATAEVVKNFSGKAVEQDSSTESPPLVASSQVEESSHLNSLEQDVLIDLFVEAADGEITKDVAEIYLKFNNWEIDKAFSCLMAEQNPTQVQAPQEGGETGSSSSDPPLPSMGLPSQSQFESSYVSSGPTETQRSLEEAGGEGDVTVAVPGMTSSQIHGKAAEEGSSTETVPVPFANQDSTTVETQTAPSTIVMTIHLSHKPGTLLELPFRSDQTVRDIHNAIDQRYPDIDRGYVLRSMDGEDYMDWDITVYRVSTGDSTFLLQVYP